VALGRRADGALAQLGRARALGALGVADRWADLAVATWSLEWNYGPGWQSVLLEAYGVESDWAVDRNPSGRRVIESEKGWRSAFLVGWRARALIGRPGGR